MVAKHNTKKSPSYSAVRWLGGSSENDGDKSIYMIVMAMVVMVVIMMVIIVIMTVRGDHTEEDDG